MKLNKLVVQAFVLGLVASTFASTETIELTGKVVDQFDNPIVGVEVEIESLALKDTTDVEGAWSIVGDVVNPIKVVPTFEAHLVDDELHLNLNSNSLVRLNMTDAQGQSVYKISKSIPSGFQSIGLPKDLSFGVYYLQILLKGQTQILQMYKSMVGYHKQGLSIPRLNKKLAPPASKTDKLVYRLQGYILTADDIESYRQYIEKFLETRNINGAITPSSKTTISKVYANFSGGEMPDALVTRLGWNVQSGLYSGKIYSVKPIAGNLFEYQVFVYGLDTAENKTSQSVQFEFDSYFQDITLPNFEAGNAMPLGLIGGGSQGYLDTDINLSADVYDDFGVINKYEWDLGTGSFITGLDTTVFNSDILGEHEIRLRVTDNDSNVSIFTKVVTVLSTSDYLIDFRDEKVYDIVQIGDQVWMAENLNYGSFLEVLVPDLPYQESDEKFCFDNSEQRCTTSGGLYQWHTAMSFDKECADGSQSCASQIATGSHQGICPNGWHVPKEADWDTLRVSLNSQLVGYKMKLAGFGGDNSSGFEAFPTGLWLKEGRFDGITSSALYWTALETNFNIANYVVLGVSSTNLSSGSIHKPDGLSVRCLKDQ
jgi:uncharacterized protein (TIGR02145 family)